MKFTKNDIFILHTVYALGATNPLTSSLVTRIIKESNLSSTKVRTTIRNLVSEGYLKEGYKDYSAKTYYIAEQGVEELRAVGILNSEDTKGESK